MRNGLIGFFIGVITTIIITCTVLSDDIFQTIQVEFNKIILELNGTKVATDNILYNGSTYVQIRSVAELLGLKVEFDEATSTANIYDEYIRVIEEIKTTQPELGKELEELELKNKEMRNQLIQSHNEIKELKNKIKTLEKLNIDN